MSGSLSPRPTFSCSGRALSRTLEGASAFGSFYLTVGSGMASLEGSKLSSLQQDVLDAFFARENRFFLTGGAALAGFYLHHRETHDLDLFVLDDVLDDGAALLYEIARGFEASVESIQKSPDFRRFLFRRGSESIVIDLYLA